MLSAGGDMEVCLQVSIVNDTVAENCAESFSVALVSSDAPIGSPSQADIQILDDDGMYVSFLYWVIKP